MIKQRIVKEGGKLTVRFDFEESASSVATAVCSTRSNTTKNTSTPLQLGFHEHSFNTEP
jgi:hypothetical protein